MDSRIPGGGDDEGIFLAIDNSLDTLVMGTQHGLIGGPDVNP